MKKMFIRISVWLLFFCLLLGTSGQAAITQYTYDNLDRLNAASGWWGTLDWTYDKTGNRLRVRERSVLRYYARTIQHLLPPSSTPAAVTDRT